MSAFRNWTMADVNRHVESVAKSKKPTADKSQNNDATKKAKEFAAVIDKEILKGIVKAKKPRKPAYTEEQVKSWCKEFGLFEPVFEYQFHSIRKWRFDIAFHKTLITQSLIGVPMQKITFPNAGGVAVEIQGGLWIKGGHNRGAQMKKDWEKLHEAQILGWKMVYCEPKDLLTHETASIVKRLLES